MMGLGFAGLAWGLRAGRAQRRPSVNSRLIFINADQTAMLFGGAQRITDAIAKARAARVDGVRLLSDLGVRRFPRRPFSGRGNQSLEALAAIPPIPLTTV